MSEPLAECEVGPYQDLIKRPNPSGLVLKHMPALPVIVEALEKKNNRELTDEERELVRQQAIVMAMNPEIAAAVDADQQVHPKFVLCVVLSFEAAEFARRLSASEFVDMLTIEGDELRGTNYHFEMDWCAPDPRMVDSFRYSACRVNPSISQSEIEVIAAHTSVLYLVSPALVNDEAALAYAQHALLIVTMLAAIGCPAVKCESSGIAHSMDRWTSLSDDVRSGFRSGASGEDGGYDLAFARLFNAWVRLPIASERWIQTRGMQLLGRPDVMVPAEIAIPQAVDVLSAFAIYSCRNFDRMDDGQGFRMAADGPRWVMTRVEPSEKPDITFYNPWGAWQLRPEATVEPEPEPTPEAQVEPTPQKRVSWWSRLIGRA